MQCTKRNVTSSDSKFVGADFTRFTNTATGSETHRVAKAEEIPQADPNLGPSCDTSIVPFVQQERIVNVLGNPRRLVEIGQAAPLLAFIIQACMRQNECTLKLGRVAAELGVSETTVKTWAEKLEQIGLVKRESRGAAGVRVIIQHENWPAEKAAASLLLMQKCMANRLASLKEVLSATLDSSITAVGKLGGLA